jgi:hypothetical protein
MQCLKDMLSLTTQDSVYLIIDALDECPNNFGMLSAEQIEKRDLLCHVSVMCRCVKKPTSRPETLH